MQYIDTSIHRYSTAIQLYSIVRHVYSTEIQCCVVLLYRVYCIDVVVYCIGVVVYCMCSVYQYCGSEAGVPD